MAVMTFRLKHGYVMKVDGEAVLQYEVGLKELTGGDIIESQEAAEQVIELPNGKVAAYVSDVKMGLNMLCRQVEYIGDVPGPLSIGQLKKLHREDLALLQSKASELDKLTMEAVAARGRV